MTVLCYEGVAGNDVVKGQVFDLAEQLALHGTETSVVCFERIDRYLAGRREVAALASEWGSDGPRATVVPRLAGPVAMGLASLVCRVLLGRARGVIHARGMKSGVLASSIASVRRRDTALVLDLRGAEPEEAADLIARGVRVEQGLGLHSVAQVSRRLNSIERRALHMADRVVCVSAALAEHLSGKYGIPRDMIAVVPGAAPANAAFSVDVRVSTRRTLGVLDDLVVCHLGGLSPVHRPDHIASVVGEIARVSAAPVTLLLLTRDKETAGKLERVLAPEIKVVAVAVERESISECLCAADIGLLTLDDALRNRVAFPVKFAEYACSGLPVIATPFAADPASYIKEWGMGVLVRRQDEGRWLTEWPEGESLAQAIVRLARVSTLEREVLAQRASLSMRQDHTAMSLQRVYSTACSAREQD